MANEIVTEIRLELDKLRADLREATEASKKAGQEVGKGVSSGLDSAFGMIQGKLVRVLAAVGGALLGKESIQAAMEQEAAIVRLNAAMANAGIYSAQASAHLQGFASALQRTTGVADELINNGQALLVSIGKLKGEGIDRATRASLDLAAGLGIDVTSAFELVSKAASGHANVLARYGIRVKETKDETEQFDFALKKIEASFGGMAVARANTFAGALQTLRGGFGELLESLGMIVTKSPVLLAVMRDIGKSFFDLADHLGAAVKNDPIGQMIKGLLELGRVVTTWVGPVFETFFHFLTLGFQTIKAGVLEFLALFSTDFKAAAEQATATMQATAMGGLQFPVTQAAEDYITRLQKVAETARPVAQNIANQIKEDLTPKGITFDAVIAEMARLENRVQMSAASIAKTMNTFIVQGMSTSFAAFGEALVKGGNAFEAFGKSVLKAIGSLLIQFGSMLIAVGVGLSTVPFLFGLQGPAAIAAGVAATVLGGAITALSGGGASQTPQATAGGGVAADTGSGLAPSSGLTALSSEDTQKKGTAVTVNVHGNILDRRETGLEIAEIINEAFGSNGVVFAKGIS